jgi:hypothetical protein
MGFFSDFLDSLRGDAKQDIGSSQAKKDKTSVQAKDFLDSASFENLTMNPQEQVNKLAQQGSAAVETIGGRNVMRTDMFTKSEAEQRRDDRDAQNRAQAAATPVVTETEEEEDPDTTNTETTEVTTTTPAVQSVLQDAEKGPKSGTIATSAQGIDKDDTTGLRPKRGLRSKQRLGMLASYQPSNTQSLLAGA